jgi:NAD(P)-dependent dehydrogenase (short-subunit alcohol dehydrogenase family)
MTDRFAGKVAVITGGSTGMGLATAKRFVREAMDHVFITGRRKDALDRAVAEIDKNVTAVLRGSAFCTVKKIPFTFASK